MARKPRGEGVGGGVPALCCPDTYGPRPSRLSCFISFLAERLFQSLSFSLKPSLVRSLLGEVEDAPCVFAIQPPRAQAGPQAGTLLRLIGMSDDADGIGWP